MLLIQLLTFSVPSHSDWYSRRTDPTAKCETGQRVRASAERTSSVQLNSGSSLHALTGRLWLSVGNMATFFAPGRRYALLLSGLVLLLLFSLRSFPTTSLGPLPTAEGQQAPPEAEGTERDGDRTVVAALPLPPEYNATGPGRSSEPQSQFCRDRFSTKFLEDFRDRRAGYCSESSASGLTCFHTVNSGSFASGSLDSFCIVQKGVVFDVKQQKFTFDCQIRELSDQEKALGAAPFEDLQSYQYLTGPKYILKEWMDLKIKKTPKFLGGGSVESSQHKEKSFVILMKREVDGNLWLAFLRHLSSFMDCHRASFVWDAETKTFCDRICRFLIPDMKTIKLLTDFPGIASTRSWQFYLRWMSCAPRLTRSLGGKLCLVPRTFKGRR